MIAPTYQFWYGIVPTHETRGIVSCAVASGLWFHWGYASIGVMLPLFWRYTTFGGELTFWREPHTIAHKGPCHQVTKLPLPINTSTTSYRNCTTYTRLSVSDLVITIQLSFNRHSPIVELRTMWPLQVCSWQRKCKCIHRKHSLLLSNCLLAWVKCCDCCCLTLIRGHKHEVWPLRQSMVIYFLFNRSGMLV